MEATYIKSSAALDQMPQDNYPEYAFVGRSNVGKSSWINCLCQRNKLAHISSNPGKTQTINHFLIDHTWYLVDLPGYGYAKVSKALRKGFSKMIRDYLMLRPNLVNIYLLIDARVPPQDLDLEFMLFLGKNRLPFTILFTKTDKLNAYELADAIKLYESRLLASWESLPPMITTSSFTGLGRDSVLSQISEFNEMYYQSKI